MANFFDLTDSNDSVGLDTNTDYNSLIYDNAVKAPNSRIDFNGLVNRRPDYNGLPVRGLSGNDIIFGRESFGDDINGNRGNDSISGFGGNDTLRGGIGDDIISGGFGNDFVNGNIGDDYITGDFVSANNANSGRDILRSGQGKDTIYGNEGNDVLIGDLGADFLIGGLGADTFALRADAGNAVSSIFVGSSLRACLRIQETTLFAKFRYERMRVYSLTFFHYLQKQ